MPINYGEINFRMILHRSVGTFEKNIEHSDFDFVFCIWILI